MLVNLPLLFGKDGQLSPEMAELQKEIFDEMRHHNTGEILQVDSSQFFNLALFKKDE